MISGNRDPCPDRYTIDHFECLARDHAERLGVWWAIAPDGSISLNFHSFGRRGGFENQQGKGNGRVALQEVCALADRYHIVLTLDTCADKLIAYYQAFGFRRLKPECTRPFKFIRFPDKKAIAT